MHRASGPVIAQGQQLGPPAQGLTLDITELSPKFTQRIGAGQHVWLRIESISGWQWHAFSIASPPRSRFLELTINATGKSTSWTQQLATIEESQARVPNFPIFRLQFPLCSRTSLCDQIDSVAVTLCGPFGSSYSDTFNDSQAVVLIGSGSRIASATSIFRHLCQQLRPRKTLPLRHIHLVWVTSDVHDLFAIWWQLRRCLAKTMTDFGPDEQLKLSFHLSQAASKESEREELLRFSELKLQETGLNAAEIRANLYMVECLRAGRPNDAQGWAKVFRTAVESGATAIDTFCSVTSASFTSAVREAARSVHVPVTHHGA